MTMNDDDDDMKIYDIIINDDEDDDDWMMTMMMNRRWDWWYYMAARALAAVLLQRSRLGVDDHVTNCSRLWLYHYSSSRTAIIIMRIIDWKQPYADNEYYDYIIWHWMTNNVVYNMPYATSSVYSSKLLTLPTIQSDTIICSEIWWIDRLHKVHWHSIDISSTS